MSVMENMDVVKPAKTPPHTHLLKRSTYLRRFFRNWITFVLPLSFVFQFLQILREDTPNTGLRL